MAQVGATGAVSVNAIGGNQNSSGSFSGTPAGAAMGIWIASVVLILFVLMSL